MNISLLSIDIAKEVFQLHGVDRNGEAKLRRRVRRNEFLRVIESIPRSRVVLEAGWSAHYWAREIKKLGHEVELIAPQHVKPFVQTNKSDANDAAAICEAARRPGMKFIGVKTVEQQEIQMLHRVRSRYVRQRTALCNEIRGFLSEYGVVMKLGVKAVRVKLSETLSANETLSGITREMFQELAEELRRVDAQVARYDRQLIRIADSHPVCERLQKVKGIGPLTATALISSVAEPHRFKNGRAFAANFGLVPRHSGTGGQNKIGSMSKRGDVYLRQLLIHGARSALRTAKKRADKQSLWSIRVMERVGFNKAVVAMANKNARIVWKLMTTDQSYNSNLAAA
jgi:transposase